MSFHQLRSDLGVVLCDGFGCAKPLYYLTTAGFGGVSAVDADGVEHLPKTPCVVIVGNIRLVCCDRACLTTAVEHLPDELLKSGGFPL